MKTTRNPRPYWLADGSERCEVCGHAYVLEMERRCAGCDAGTCEQCSVMVRETRLVLCAPCHRTEEG